MRAGFQAGDLILAANGEAVPLWMDWVTYVRARPEQTMEVLVERNNVRQSLSVTPSGIVRRVSGLVRWVCLWSCQ